MKSLKCSDLGSMECNFVATGETAEDVKKNMYEHAGQVHPDKLEKMTDEEKQQIDKKMDELLA